MDLTPNLLQSSPVRLPSPASEERSLPSQLAAPERSQPPKLASRCETPPSSDMENRSDRFGASSDHLESMFESLVEVSPAERQIPKSEARDSLASPHHPKGVHEGDSNEIKTIDDSTACAETPSDNDANQGAIKADGVVSNDAGKLRDSVVVALPVALVEKAGEVGDAVPKTSDERKAEGDKALGRGVTRNEGNGSRQLQVGDETHADRKAADTSNEVKSGPIAKEEQTKRETEKQNPDKPDTELTEAAEQDIDKKEPEEGGIDEHASAEDPEKTPTRPSTPDKASSGPAPHPQTQGEAAPTVPANGSAQLNSSATQSVPLHLRLSLQGPPRAPGLQSRWHSPPYQNGWSLEGPRVTRAPYQPFRNRDHPSSDRNFDIRDELARTQAALTRVRQELASEHLTNQTMRPKVEAEVRNTTETAFHAMLKDLLRKQILVIKQSADLHKRANDIKRREQLAQQLESFLTIGQQQIYLAREVQQREVYTIAPAELDLARRQGEAEAVQKFHEVELKLTTLREQLNLRESNLAMREAAYKAQVCDALETELRRKLESEIEARVTECITEAEYQRGFEAGKAAENTDHREKVQGNGFVEGYNACRKTMDALLKFRAGKIPYDSPDLDFLTNSDHPWNPFNMGMQIGRLGAQETKELGKT
ncbi:hypothetical protein K458DRAFT_115607 [Lentithecium fluviatile CBS 122367]|uniref:Uncharacterized protein n=1 Tax=Lentithecium fluviatile CBS 122367 TaxID=1168545 RepID=A0A6G1INU1_9PLEO|nr:hypothetical protein K458DRAFT_115607 [Lentithecium fluviatile CBS 122367]